MSFLTPEVSEDVRSLIVTLTGFDPEVDKENVDLCYDYMTSNLLYHNCLDPRAKQVNKDLRSVFMSVKKSSNFEFMI